MNTSKVKFQRTRRGIIAGAALALTLGGVAACSSDEAEEAPEDSASEEVTAEDSDAESTDSDEVEIAEGAPTTVDQLEAPIIIAHRGGADVYPEESMEGFLAAAKDGFLPEMDIQFMSDGVPVLLHDDEVDRTMEGVEGDVSDLTSEDWDNATIVSPTGGESAPAAYFEEVLDAFGGKIVIVPEVKPGAGPDEVHAVIDLVKDRGLEENVLMQSFDYDAVVQMKEAGLTPLYLVKDEVEDGTLEKMQEDGIEWLGPDKDLDPDVMAEFDDAGIIVAPYTVANSEEADQLPDAVSGWFTNDPWS